MGIFQTIIRSNHQEIFQEDTPILHLSVLDIGTNYQDFLAGTQMIIIDKVDDIERIEMASLAPIEIE